MSDRFGNLLNKVKSHGDSFYDKLHTAVHEAGDSVKEHLAVKQDPDHTSEHRFRSFAPQRSGNQAKWYVDGCDYFYAVSVALEEARESVWILDWWLSPETYLRRPPADNEDFRLDCMLQKAAERGVKVKIIVYKEVTQALNLSSWHTKHALEDMHPNIAVMRHPDHLPDGMALKQSFIDSFSNFNLTAANASRLGGDALHAIYGMNDGTVLYWAHHEKLCLIDGKIAFMGGLDLCHGRWDLHHHPIADVHPGDLNQILFVGQDYNNARIMDFENVGQWQDNRLNRKWNARMGWSDISVSLAGSVVQDLQAHFTQRWNYIHRDKYDSRKDTERFHYLDFEAGDANIIPYTDGASAEQPQGEHHLRDLLRREVDEGRQRLLDHGDLFRQHFSRGSVEESQAGHIPCQIMRSSCKWSSGGSVEQSISSAYIESIRESQFFVYIENQFFITATGDQQKPIKNQIGAAIVERVVRAHREQQPYKIIVIIPAVPAFPGDLKGDDALSTRAIMEFQYFSICRGGHSIYEELRKQGIDPEQYIRFYNLRNYDRINVSAALQTAEGQSGVDYDTARRGADRLYGRGFDDNATAAPSQRDQRAPQSQQAGLSEQDRIEAFSRFQSTAHDLGPQHGLATGEWDSVAQCAMLGSPPLGAAPWTSPLSELDAFVSEELYVHSKVLIADDRVVICGSANLNDRSQLGTHDSEIAVRIDDTDTVDSTMAGQPFRASRFAASLRRFLFRKHLGLVPPQDATRCKGSANAQPVIPEGGGGPRGANDYDWGSEADRAVEDPLGAEFGRLWEGTARANTEAFERVFHPVPSDKVRNWGQYDDIYGRFFKHEEEAKVEGHDERRPSTWKWGHVVAEEFSQGGDGVREVREVLGRVRGSLVEMPLRFLEEEDIAKEGMALNAFTEEVYT